MPLAASLDSIASCWKRIRVVPKANRSPINHPEACVEESYAACGKTLRNAFEKSKRTRRHAQNFQNRRQQCRRGHPPPRFQRLKAGSDYRAPLELRSIPRNESEALKAAPRCACQALCQQILLTESNKCLQVPEGKCHALLPG